MECADAEIPQLAKECTTQFDRVSGAAGVEEVDEKKSVSGRVRRFSAVIFKYRCNVRTGQRDSTGKGRNQMFFDNFPFGLRATRRKPSRVFLQSDMSTR